LLLVCLELELPIGRYFGYVATRAALGAIPVAAFLYWVQTAFALQSYFRLAIAGLITVFVFAVVWVAFVLRNDPHIDVQSRLNLLWARRLRPAS